MSAALPLDYFARWLATGERGLSSEAIVGHLTGTPMGSDHPRDPGDFRRCQKLLAGHGLADVAFRPIMRAVSPEWARLIDSWDEIAEAMGRAEHGRAPEAFRLIQEATRPKRSTR